MCPVVVRRSHQYKEVFALRSQCLFFVSQHLAGKERSEMKIGIYNNVRGGKARFTPYADKYPDLELIEMGCAPTMENLDKIKEYG